MNRGPERRKKIWEWMQKESAPFKGVDLARRLGVSRQVIVGDMQILRHEHPEIGSGRRGYYLKGAVAYTRVFKVLHHDEDIRKELELIVDNGGHVRDVFVYHKAYGRLTAPLEVRCSQDIDQLIFKMKTGKSRSLLSTASGYHYHTVQALSEGQLDIIAEKLAEAGMLLDSAPDAESIS